MSSQERADDLPYKLIFAPKKFYDPIDAAKHGWWAELATDHGSVGVLWHDRDKGLGFFGVLGGQANYEIMTRIDELVKSAAGGAQTERPAD